MSKDKFKKTVASFEQSQFISGLPGQNPEVSMEGFADILNSIKESYTKWRMASINKRPKAAEQLIDKVSVWTFNVNRQLKRTYAEPRWISQKLAADPTPIDVSMLSTLLTVGDTGKAINFAEAHDLIVKTNEIIEEFFFDIQEYLNALFGGASVYFRPDGYPEVVKKFELLTKPSDLINKHLSKINQMIGNKVIESTKEAFGEVYSFTDSKKPAASLTTMEPLNEKEFRDLALILIETIDMLASSNSAKEWVYLDIDDILQTYTNNIDHYKDVQHHYNKIVNEAMRHRNYELASALNPTYWNSVFTQLIHDVNQLNLELSKAILYVLNENLEK